MNPNDPNTTQDAPVPPSAPGSTPVTAVSPTALPWKSFLQQVFSDKGMPSSSRILTFLLAIGCFTLLAVFVHHMIRVTDSATLGVWLSSLPAIVFALIAFVNAPYLINKGGGTLSDVASVFKRPDQGR
jgi:hypothetical protein